MLLKLPKLQQLKGNKNIMKLSIKELEAIYEMASHLVTVFEADHEHTLQEKLGGLKPVRAIARKAIKEAEKRKFK